MFSSPANYQLLAGAQMNESVQGAVHAAKV
jgi:hypothetical protein